MVSVKKKDMEDVFIVFGIVILIVIVKWYLLNKLNPNNRRSNKNSK